MRLIVLQSPTSDIRLATHPHRHRIYAKKAEQTVPCVYASILRIPHILKAARDVETKKLQSSASYHLMHAKLPITQDPTAPISTPRFYM